jgi:hypothetical protein
MIGFFKNKCMNYYTTNFEFVNSYTYLSIYYILSSKVMLLDFVSYNTLDILERVEQMKFHYYYSKHAGKEEKRRNAEMRLQ